MQWLGWFAIFCIVAVVMSSALGHYLGAIAERYPIADDED